MRIFPCPLCDWTLQVPDVPEAPAALADALGMSRGAITATWQHNQARQTEDDLRAHLKTHPIEEWATELRRLRDHVAQLERLARR